MTADLLDVSDGGIGISVLAPLAIGLKVVVRGALGESRSGIVNAATVRWCTEKTNGACFAGLEFDDNSPPRNSNSHSSVVSPNSEELDCYEIMQLSPNADGDTIQRVYRVLAQRYHPDSLRTGNSDMFRRLCEAHRILSNPELRAQYDVHHREKRQIHWNIFDQAKAARGPEEEQRKRRGILELLYAKALHDPERATMTLFDFEQLLGCPREHLEAAVWYLKGKGYVKRGDSGRITITIQGFDEVEGVDVPAARQKKHLLESGTSTED
jgi:hypothetical protein